MQKNQERISVVSTLGMNGEGILKDNNETVFVPYALAGEKIKYKLVKCSSKANYGKLLEVFTPAEDRVRPPCKVFTKCGGCQLQHLKYEKQLKFKENKIATCFLKIANLDVNVSKTVCGDSEFRYRNKLQLPVGQAEDGVVVGFYAENSHRIVPILDCEINAKWTANLISALKKYMAKFSLRGYDEKTRSGDVREITAKEINGNLLITLVISKDSIRNVDEFIKILSQEINLPFSLYLNVNKSDTNLIYGDKFIKVYGESEYQAEMLGIKYKIGVRSFSQVNTVVCEKLYATVKDLIKMDANTTVIDAYSGAGLMTCIIAKDVKKVVGIEIIKEAVEIANELKNENELGDVVTNYHGKCEELLPKIVKNLKQNDEEIAVILDPPRKGCEYPVIKALIDANVDKIVYVSCNPSTLARDVGLLVGSLVKDDKGISRADNYEARYQIDCVKPFDMFAQTKHVETLVSLTKR